MPDTDIRLLLATALGVSLLAGVGGTAAGGLIGALGTRPGRIITSMLLGFAAGIMLAIVAFDLMPEAFAAGSLFTGLVGLVGGVLLVLFVDIYLPHLHFAGSEMETSRFHNLPEGLAIGTGYAHGEQLGLGVAIAIGVHNVPEGLAMALPMMRGRFSRLRAVAYTAAAGMPQVIGALLGVLFGYLSTTFLSLSLGVAAGAMLYITCDELIPAASEQSRGHSATFGIVAGVVLGIVLSHAIVG